MMGARATQVSELLFCLAKSFKTGIGLAKVRILGQGIDRADWGDRHSAPLSLLKKF